MMNQSLERLSARIDTLLGAVEEGDLETCVKAPDGWTVTKINNSQQPIRYTWEKGTRIIVLELKTSKTPITITISRRTPDDVKHILKAYLNTTTGPIVFSVGLDQCNDPIIMPRSLDDAVSMLQSYFASIKAAEDAAD